MIQRVIDVEATCHNIRRLSKDRGYSAAELQEALNLASIQAIYKWFSGKSLPSTDNLVLLAGVLGVSIDDIIIVKTIEVER